MTARPIPPAPIAGPRRARPPVLPPAPAPAPAAAPTGLVAQRPAAVAVPAPATAAQARGSARALPPLDYDDTSPAQRSASDGRLDTTRPGKRRKSRRVVWFMLGISFGASGAVFARGDSMGTLHAVRAWGANALRSLEREPAPAVVAAPAVVTANAVRHAEVQPKDAPCPVDPRPGDPCAELLAPFAAHVPTVSIDDLPRVKPAPVATVAPVVIVGRHVRGATPPSQPVAQEHEDMQATPRGINPDDDEPQATPARVGPTSPPPAPKAPSDAPSTELQSARNETT